MRVFSMRWALVAAPMFFMTANASGQLLWSDNFDSYPDTSLIEYQGGWTGWWLSGPGPSAVTSTQSNSAPHSGAIITGSDTVYNWDGNHVGGMNEPAPDCGEWTFTGQVYAPSGGTGKNYVILLHNYNGAGLNTQWAAQVGLNWDSGLIECDCGTDGVQTAPLILDQWVEFRVEVDLDQDPLLATANTHVYYNGVELGVGYPWSMGVFGTDQYLEPLRIEALDLYPVPGSSTLFWDDLTLTQTATGNCPVGTNYCASTPFSTGTSTISGSGSGSISANDLVLSADNLPSQPGIFIAGPTQAQIPFFNGFLCINPTGLQRFVNVANPSGGTITEAVNYATSAAGGLNASAGSSYQYQRWNRDPAAGGGNANFSNGLEVMHTL